MIVPGLAFTLFLLAAPPADAAPYPAALVLTWGWFSEPEGAYVCDGKVAAILFLRIEKDGATLENEPGFGNALRDDTDGTPRSAPSGAPGWRFSPGRRP